LTIETRVKGDDVRVALDRGEQRLGTFLMSNQTICWVPAASEMTWVMTWEQFSEVMQSFDIGEVVRLNQSAYASAARAGAGTVPHEAGFDAPMPKPREKLSLRRHFNSTEFALIRKGGSSGDKWTMYFDSTRGELRMYRTWSGICIFSLRFREDSDGGEISEAWVHRKEGGYTKQDAIEIASSLIDVFLLGRNQGYPSESKSETDE
jgi:hypothetical protein